MVSSSPPDPALYIRLTLAAHGVRAARVAERANISAWLLSRIMNGHRKPSPELVATIAKAAADEAREVSA